MQSLLLLALSLICPQLTSYSARTGAKGTFPSLPVPVPRAVLRRLGTSQALKHFLILKYLL